MDLNHMGRVFNDWEKHTGHHDEGQVILMTRGDLHREVLRNFRRVAEVIRRTSSRDRARDNTSN